MKVQKKQDKPDLSSEISSVKYENEFFDTQPTRRKWYEEFSEDPSEHVTLPQEKVHQLKAEAKMILADEVKKHELKLSRTRSDHQWMRTVLARGTTSDKIAVHTLLIQDSPLHSLSSLESLVSMAKVAKKKECITAIETLTELFLADLLPQNRKLRAFEVCPLGDSHPNLLLCYYEDQLKVVYQNFVEALSTTMHDTVDTNKEKAIVAMHKLLSGCPEQEVVLLRNLVNKLGDPSAKVVSKVIYCLGQLLRNHSNMKAVVMEEIEKLLFRPNVSTRAQYYCICFLSQFVFTSSDAVVAKNLISLYFSFFKASIKKGDVDSRMMSVLLMGVNRAYPFAKSELRHISEHVDTMYKVVHMGSFNVGLHTLCLLYHICDQTSSLSDRFYCALYKKIGDPDLVTSGHQAMFLSLLFRALRKDTHDGRIRAFVKKLLQVCLYAPVPLACGILYMASQLIYRRSNLLALSYAVCFADDCDDEADEHYNDVKLQESDTVAHEGERDGQPDVEATVAAGGEAHATWQHYDNMKYGRGLRGRRYDPLQRNPTFAGAEHAAYVELLQLSHHFHPTVALFANNILSGTLTNYNGDPLLDFTLSRFLDRFVFKNPKKMAIEDHIHPFDRKKKYVASGARALRVNSANYLNMQEWTIPEDERFLYRYLYMRQAKKISEGAADSDVESVASEEFEDMLDKLTGIKDRDGSLDFAHHISAKSASSRRKGNKHSDEAGSSDEESTQEDFEEANGYSTNDESIDDDASDIVFDNDDDHGGSEGDIANELKQFQLTSEQDTRTSQKKYKAKKKNSEMRSMFASADEFAEILQDEGMSGGKGALSNEDKAGVKQLQWESARDYWLNRTDKKRRRKAGSGKTKKPRSR